MFVLTAEWSIPTDNPTSRQNPFIPAFLSFIYNAYAELGTANLSQSWSFKVDTKGAFIFLLLYIKK